MTSPKDLPSEVQNLVLRSISSVALLEALLLLHRDPARAWSETEVSNELRSTPTAAADQLRSLADSGLAESIPAEGKFRFRSSKENDAVVQRLAETYSTHRVALITFIYERPTERLRGFANAFKFRKDE